MGAYPLHLAASNGSYQILDTLLDQEGVEVDPVDRLEGDTPLHKAVRFVNGLGEGEWEAGCAIVELLVDAGADVRYVLLSSTFSPLQFFVGGLSLQMRRKEAEGGVAGYGIRRI